MDEAMHVAHDAGSHLPSHSSPSSSRLRTVNSAFGRCSRVEGHDARELRRLGGVDLLSKLSLDSQARGHCWSASPSWHDDSTRLIGENDASIAWLAGAL